MRTPKYRIRPDRDSAFVEIDGERIPLPGRANSDESRDAYRRIIADYLLRHQSTKKQLPQRPAWLLTVAELCAAWLDHCQVYYSGTAHTRSNEYDNCRLAVRPLIAKFGELTAGSLGPPELKELREVLANGGWACENAKRPIKPWSRQHINATVAKIKRMYRWGVEAGMVSPQVSAMVSAVSPLHKGRTAAKEMPPTLPVPLWAVEATLPFLPSVVAAMVQVQRLAGMRSHNICTLRSCDIDQSRDVWVYRPEGHKSEHQAKNLFVPIGPQAQAILKPFLDRPADAYCFSPREVGRYTVQAARIRVRGMHYITNTYRNAVRRAIVRANKKRLEDAREAKIPAPEPIPHWHPHQLRHLRTEEVKAYDGIEGSRAYLGHSSVRTTEIYDARDLSRALRIAREIG